MVRTRDREDVLSRIFRRWGFGFSVLEIQKNPAIAHFQDQLILYFIILEYTCIDALLPMYRITWITTRTAKKYDNDMGLCRELRRVLYERYFDIP